MKITKLFQGKHRKKLTIAAAAALGLALCTLCMIPRAAMAAATQRDLPIYCVQKDSKVCSLTFDAAWADANVRQNDVPGPDTCASNPSVCLPTYLHKFLQAI